MDQSERAGFVELPPLSSTGMLITHTHSHTHTNTGVHQNAGNVTSVMSQNCSAGVAHKDIQQMQMKVCATATVLTFLEK